MPTTCAIAGRIVALCTQEQGIPQAWLEVREPFPQDFLSDHS